MGHGSALLDQLVAMPADERAAAIARLTPRERRALRYSWEFWGRPDQVWRPDQVRRHTWILAGRGWGKTRVGAEAIRWLARHPEVCGDELAIAGRTAGDRNATMLYGPSGLMRIGHPDERPQHRVQDAELVWRDRRGRPCARARLMSGDVPASFRGPGFGAVWTDELWHWARAEECWAQLEFTMREGDNPQTINTSTPVPSALLLRLVFEVDDAGRPIPDAAEPAYGWRLRSTSRVVRGSSDANRAHLARAFVAETIEPARGTRFGSQEVDGAILLDLEGALWRWDWFTRCDALPADVELARVVVSVDPSGSKRATAAECGINAWGLRAGPSPQIYGLAERSRRASPYEWALEAISLFDELAADEIVAERNYGGDLVRTTIASVAQLPEVVHARRAKGYTRPVVVADVDARASKGERAAIVAPLWQQRRVHHVGDPRVWAKFEHQCAQVDPWLAGSELVDARDAGVQAVTYLLDAAGVPRPRKGQWRSMAATLRERR